MRHCEAAVIFYSYQSWPLLTSCIATINDSNCKLPLTPACLTTCCCLATFPFSDVKQTVFALLPGNRTDINGCKWMDIYIWMDVYKYIFRSDSRGSRYARAFAPTDLLTSLREESSFAERATLFTVSVNSSCLWLLITFIFLI